jgi:hypothetical protein
MQELTEVDKVLPLMLAFTRKFHKTTLITGV